VQNSRGSLRGIAVQRRHRLRAGPFPGTRVRSVRTSTPPVCENRRRFLVCRAGLGPAATDPSAGQPVPHRSGPPGRVRALHRAVGGRSRPERWCATSAGGRTSTVGGEPGSGRGGQVRRCRDRADGRGHPGEGAGGRSRRTRGGAEDGVPRLAAVVAQDISRARSAPGTEAAGTPAPVTRSRPRVSGGSIVGSTRAIRGPERGAGHPAPGPAPSPVGRRTRISPPGTSTESWWCHRTAPVSCSPGPPSSAQLRP
jgi:hypothetical protein